MIQKMLISQPRPTTEHNPYSRMEEQFGVQCDFYQLIHIEGLNAGFPADIATLFDLIQLHPAQDMFVHEKFKIELALSYCQC